MFKLSRLFRSLLQAGLFHMTEDPTEGLGTGGGGGGGDPGAGNEGLDPAGGGQGGLQPPVVNPWDAVPRSWAQQHHAHWGKTPAEVRQIIHEREQAVERGFSSYRPAVENWNKLTSKFQEYTAQQPDADVAGLYETLAENHLALVRATPEQRRDLFGQLAKAYGVDFANAAASGGASGGPDIQALVQQQVNAALQPIHAERAQAQLQRAQGAVDAFFSDAKNEFVNEVAPLMTQIVQSGIRDLSLAYQTACLQSPEVRVKYLAKLAQSGAGGQGGAQAPGDRNLRTTGAGAPPGESKSIDDTMEAVAAKHYGKQ